MKYKQAVKVGLMGAAALGLVFAALHNGFAFAQTPQSSVQLGKTESRCNFASSTMTSSSEFSTFNSRHVLLVVEDNHPLTRRIASLLIERLKNCSNIETIDQAKPSQILAEGTQSPDFFLRISVLRLTEGGIASRSMKATVSASLGDTPWQSHDYSIDATTPPRVHFYWTSTGENETSFSGFRTDKYAEPALSIANEFAKGISNALQSLSLQFSPLPKLPHEFYGPYKPVEDFSFLKDLQARRACSYFDLLTHNQTFWTFEAASNPIPQLLRLRHQLEATNWTLSSASLTNTQDYSLSFRQGANELKIFRAHQPNIMEPQEQEGSIQFVVQYRMPFSSAEREAALEGLFTQENAFTRLQPFQNQFTGSQRERFFALAETSSGDSPQSYLQLARTYMNRKQTNTALNMLLCAKALADTREGTSAIQNAIETEAKKISPDNKLVLKITPELCRKLKFLEITNALQAFEVQRDFGTPIVLFADGKNGVKTFSFTVSQSKNGIYPWKMIETEDSSRSSTSSSFSAEYKGGWHEAFTYEKQTLEIQATPLDKTRLRYTVKAKL